MSVENGTAHILSFSGRATKTVRNESRRVEIILSRGRKKKMTDPPFYRHGAPPELGNALAEL